MLPVPIPLFQPLNDLGGELLLETGTDVDADVAGLQADVLGILAAHPAGEQLASRRWHQVIEQAVKIEQRHGDLLQVHPLAAQFHLALDEEVLLVAVADELAEGFAGHVGAVEDPLLHAHEVFHEGLVVHVLHESDVLVDHQPGRVQQQKTEVHHVTGHVAVSVDHAVDIELLHPDVQQALIGVEIGGRHRGDQVFDLLGVQGRIHHAEGAAHADAHQVDLVDAVFLADEIHGAVYVTVDVVVDGQKPVLAAGIAPVDHVQVHAVVQETLHHAAAGLQVEHGLPVDQGIDYQQGCFELDFPPGPVVLELDAVFLPDDIVGRCRDARFQFFKQHVRGPAGAFVHLPGIFGQFGKNQINRYFRCTHFTTSLFLHHLLQGLQALLDFVNLQRQVIHVLFGGHRQKLHHVREHLLAGP